MCLFFFYVYYGLSRNFLNDAEERLHIERRLTTALSFGCSPVAEATIEDLNLELFRHVYLPKAMDEDALTQDHRKITEQLASLRLYDPIIKAPTVAGLLLLGKNPLRFLFGAYIQYVRFRGWSRDGEVLREI